MPKEVDHDERRDELADAVLRVVAEGGVGSVVLRRVAEESGWSTGVLNHYFRGKQEMLLAALGRAFRLLDEGIRAEEQARDPNVALEGMLLRALPLDDRFRGFSKVWLSYCGEALAADDVRGYLSKQLGVWQTRIEGVIRRGQLDGMFSPDVDVETAAISLAALVDGLTIRLILDPDSTSLRQVRKIVRSWVNALVGGGLTERPLTSTAVSAGQGEQRRA